MSICTHCGLEHEANPRTCPITGKTIGGSTPSVQKTTFGMFGVAPATPQAASPKLPPPDDPPFRLPTEAEARENPDLVISLDVTPPAGTQASIGARKTPPAPEATPTDLPPPGKGKPFTLPQPQEGAAPGGTRQARNRGFSDRLAADTRSVFDLLRWALDAYLRKPAPLFLLAALLVLPASVLQSCLLAGVAPGSQAGALAHKAATVDFSTRKVDLAARIRASQARGEIDKQAAAELAALTTVEAVQAPDVEEKSREGGSWIRERLALLIQGLLIFGLAVPIACGALAIATADQQGHAALPGFDDIWPILLARGELFLISLLPAALLVAAGNALFVLPGLVLSVLFIFVPHAVLFEKRGGRRALARSIELVRSDAVRVVLAFLTFALLGFVAATLTELLLPTSGNRAVVFLHFIISDLLSVAILPVPALILARIYLDLRSRSGASPERLSRAARV